MALLAGLLITVALIAGCDGSESESIVTPPIQSQAAQGPQIPKPTDQSYEIKPGDTLYGVAYDYGVTVDDLMAANNITSIYGISIGQKLIIPRPR